jgi:hypothetical protein
MKALALSLLYNGEVPDTLALVGVASAGIGWSRRLTGDLHASTRGSTLTKGSTCGTGQRFWRPETR